MWLEFCCEEEAPSPKVQAKAGPPEQFDGAAVEANATGDPEVPDAGTVAVHARVQVGDGEIVTVPPFTQDCPPAVTLSVQI